MSTTDKIQYWRRVRALTLVLLMLWFSVSFGTVWFARELASISIGGWPLHFYLASQGVTLVYLALIGAYALVMKRLDALTQDGSAAQDDVTKGDGDDA